jgi:hypothetical protein
MIPRPKRAALAAASVAAVAAVVVPSTSASAVGRELTADAAAAVNQALPTGTISTGSPTVTSFAVSADSVVATATVLYSGARPDLTVVWGDGTSTHTSPTTANVPGRPTPTAGRVVFQHVYAAGNGGIVTHHVLLVQGNFVWDRVVAIEPRYRVTQYTVQFSPLDHCDSVAEEYTEWTVYRNVENAPDKEWNFDRKTAELGGVGLPLPDFQPLPDSALSVDVTVATAKPIYYHAKENDPLSDEYFNPQAIDEDPRLGSRAVDLVFRASSSCRIELRADVDVQVLTPGVSGGPVASQ